MVLDRGWMAALQGSRRLALATALMAALMPAALVLGCGPAKEPPRRLPVVQTQPIEPAGFQAGFDTVSTLEAEEEVDLAAQAGGRIQRLLVRQGDRVRQGQLLLVLDQTQLRAEVASLRAQMQTNRLNYQRYQDLARQGAASALQRDEFRQAYIAAREALVAREADLAFKDLRAPITGTVADLRVKQGDVIEAGVPLTRLIRNDRLLARIDVPAVYAGRVRPGQRVLLLDASRAQPLAEGQVSSVDPGVAAATQTLLVKAAFANPRGSLRNGQRSRTRLVLDRREELAVPFTAVTQLAGQSFVYVVGSLADLERRPGQAALAELRQLPAGTRFALQTPVQLGDLQGNRYPVRRGLVAGDLVITAGLLNLRHGAPVQLAAQGRP
ncbi:efflux RND transporter periplasmic adaptor subunit [Cyanobium sp. FACHB-13342]|uniref:efflux RND transporter periplasmic adaptor subunit n=1 Tax=Cyanobium sp. FACHB-13342 TaxID=2692793 RepID=UPI0016806A8F|nr:efflux RND transporter periplasmic adaptor subunit [Cyanobium sp. FACHB-13342]MBD2424296.1 efflux RND transporter periplasmic adaptor subunit [Cyanobium sp. FACHB-13342]